MTQEQSRIVKGRKVDLIILGAVVVILVVDFICKKLGFSFIENLMTSFVFTDPNNIDQIESRSYVLTFIVNSFLFLLVVVFVGEGMAAVLKQKYPLFALFRPFDIKYRVGVDAISMGILWLFIGVLASMPLLMQVWYWLK
jgi:hypothetical protein